MVDKYIGENIKRVRIRAGYTQEKLAEKIDVSLSVISRLETGRTMVSVEKLLRIAKVLNAPIASIFEYPAKTGDAHTETGNYPHPGEGVLPVSADSPHLSEPSGGYTDPTDKELYYLIQQLPDKAKQYFKNSLRCYLEIF